jgi:hypothetical protein
MALATAPGKDAPGVVAFSNVNAVPDGAGQGSGPIVGHDGGLRLDVVFDHMLLTKGGGDGRHQHGVVVAPRGFAVASGDP